MHKILQTYAFDRFDFPERNYSFAAMSLREFPLRIHKPFVKKKYVENGADGIVVHHLLTRSKRLKHKVKVDVYLPAVNDSEKVSYSVLLNDGQDAEELQLIKTLTAINKASETHQFSIVAVHAGDRLNEYGTAGIPDYAGRGWKAKTYTDFVIYKLLPYLKREYGLFKQPKTSAFAGFSLGGLSAMDISWKYPQHFLNIGVFSGSFWWRSSNPDLRYPDADRIMLHLLGAGRFKPGMRFWFQVGTKDEECDRNNNGIIDAIDDTLDVIRVLKTKGYTDKDIHYLEVEGGEHNFDTWSNVFPEFLEWCIDASQKAALESI